MLGGAGYAEVDLMAHYLDDDACAALVRGKEQLSKERAEMAEGEHLGKATSTDPVQPSVSADIDIVGSSSHSPPPAQAVIESATAHTGDETQESTKAQDFEVDIVKPTSPGNLNVDLA